MSAVRSAGRLLALVFISILFCSAAGAVARFSVGGNWSATSTWATSCGGAGGASVPGGNDNVTICANTAVTLDTNPGILRDLSIQANGILTDDGVAGRVLTVGGGPGTDISNSGTVSFSSGTSIRLGANNTWAGSGTWNLGSIDLNARTLDFSGGAFTLNLSAATPIANAGTVTNPAGFELTWNFNGTVAQTLPSSLNVRYGTVNINNTAGVTLGVGLSLLNIAHHLNVQTGTLNNGGFSIALASAKSFSVSNGATFRMTGTSGMVTVSGGGTKTFGTTLPSCSTVDYAGTDQTVSAEIYGHLILSNSGTKTMPGAPLTVSCDFAMSGTASATAAGAISVTRDFTLGSGTTFIAGSGTSGFTHSVGRNFSNDGATFIASGGGPFTSTFDFNGTAGAQSIGGSTSSTFYDLRINNSSGVSASAVDETVANILTLTDGVLNTGSKTLYASASCATSVSRTSGWVAGLLKKTIPAGAPTCSFEIGDAVANYTPITGLAFTSVTSPGQLTASVSASEHPNIASSNVATMEDVNRYWTLTNSGVAMGAAASYSATFNFVSGDVDPSADTANFEVVRWDGSSWSTATIGTRTATSTQATGITAFSDFAVGHRINSFDVTASPAGSIASQTQYIAIAIRVTARDSAGNVVARFSGTVDITSLTCTVFAGGGTSANFTGGVLDTSVTIANTGACSISVTLTGASATGTSNTFTVGALAFNAFESATAANAITGNIQTRVAGAGFGTLAVVAVANGAQASGFGGNVKLELLRNTGTAGGGYGADNCPISNAVLQTVASAAVSGGRSNTAAFSAESNVYRDIRVRISYPSTSSTIAVCSGDSFAIRPSGFSIAVTDADSQTAGTTRALDNIGGSPSGGRVHRAGRPFTITATVQPNTATNYDGAFTVATSGGLTCRTDYGLGSCATGSAALGTFTASGISAVTSTATYSEAGSINLLLEDVDFASIDAGDGSSYIVPQSATAQVGRFVPDRFEFTAPSTPVLQTFGSGCAARSFTYIGQPFWYATLPSATVQAVNAGGAVTTNYRGTLFKLAGSDITETYSNNAVGTSLTSASITPAQLMTGNGTGMYTAKSDGTLVFARSTASPDPAFNANVSLTVSATDATETGTAGNGSITTASALVFNGGGPGIAFDAGNANAFRYGRLRMQNALASSGAIALPVPTETQYWNGTLFVRNADDHCTTLPAASIGLSDYRLNLGPGETSVTSDVTFNAGRAAVRLSAPGAANNGSVLVTPDLSAAGANRAYLQGAWTGGVYNENPSARGSFGVFGSQPRNFIFQRENY